MVDLRDDWVRLVGGTLPKATRMDMNVGNDAHPFVSAYFPKLAKPPTIEAEATLMASSDPGEARFRPGTRVFHDKFGYGDVVSVDGAKLDVNFDHTGRKKVIASFVEAA